MLTNLKFDRFSWAGATPILSLRTEYGQSIAVKPFIALNAKVFIMIWPGTVYIKVECDTRTKNENSIDDFLLPLLYISSIIHYIMWQQNQHATMILKGANHINCSHIQYTQYIRWIIFMQLLYLWLFSRSFHRRSLSGIPSGKIEFVLSYVRMCENGELYCEWEIKRIYAREIECVRVRKCFAASCGKYIGFNALRFVNRWLPVMLNVWLGCAMQDTNDIEHCMVSTSTYRKH